MPEQSPNSPVPLEVQAEFDAALDAYEQAVREEVEKFLKALGVTIIIEPKTTSEHIPQ